MLLLLLLTSLICRYVEIAVRLLESGRQSIWKSELHHKKLSHLAFDTVYLKPFTQN
jgi:hypothetical protein